MIVRKYKTLIKLFIIIIIAFNLFGCNLLNANKSLYDYIINMKMVSSYDTNKTIDDFDTITLGEIEQYDDRQDEKQGIEWLLLYKDNEKALLQSKYIIAIEPYTYEWDCPTYEKYLAGDSYEEYNEIGEWVNSQFDNYRLGFIKNNNSNDSISFISPFIYDWLDNTFIDEIFTKEEQDIIMPMDVTEFNHEREKIVNKRKITLMSFYDSEKYYGKLYEQNFFDKKATNSTINNKIRTKATKAVKSFVKQFDNEVIYQKGGNSKVVRLMPDAYYLNTERTNDEGYIQGAHDAVLGINDQGKYEDLEYHGTFSSTSNLFGGGQSEDSISIAGVRPCMWIDLSKAKRFKYKNESEEYVDDLIEKSSVVNYNIDDKNIIFAKTIDEYDDNDTIDDFNTIKFGRFNDKKVNLSYYELLSDNTNDIDIEWIPLEKTDNYILLLSKYVLTSVPYNEDGSRCDFNDSSLYEYLNGKLVDIIFSADEKKKLLRINNYDDTMFILDEKMVKKYFSNSNGIFCPKKVATKIVPNSNLIVNGSKFEHNWNNFNADYIIDTKGDFDGLVKYVDSNGEIYNYGALIDAYKYGIRPAIYLDLHESASELSVNIVNKETKEITDHWSNIYKWSRASISELKNKHKDMQKSNKSASASEIRNENNILNMDESVFLGRYEQDGNLENGAEDIEWNVITRDGDKVLLLSKYIIESEIISDNLHPPIYDDTVVRNKLIGEYYDKFFNNEEKEMIEERVLNNFDCPLKRYYKNKTYQSNDMMFLLSLEDIRRFFGDTNKAIEQLKTKATYYVTDVKDVRRRINDIDINNCYWLRSPGMNEGFASSQPTLDALFGFTSNFTSIESDVNNTWAMVDENGLVKYASSFIELDNSIRGSWYYNKPDYTLKTLGGIRPAIWVNESKLNAYNKNRAINKYIYEDKRFKKKVYNIKDIDKAKCLSEYSSSYSYNDFDTVRFGKYLIDKKLNKYEDIEWFVLDKNDDKIILFSKYILDDMVMWDETLPEDCISGIDVENTKCFKWLNGDFLNKSFSESEQDKILISSNNLKTNHIYYDDSKDFIYDRDVNSKVFLLNKYYIDKYFTYKDDAIGDTRYAINQKISYKDKLLIAERFGTNEVSTYWLIENLTNKTVSDETYDYINKVGLVDNDTSGEDGIRPIIIVDAKKIKK